MSIEQPKEENPMPNFGAVDRPTTQPPRLQEKENEQYNIKLDIYPAPSAIAHTPDSQLATI
ncbi:hypothetical protein FRX31_002960 [Thalictrum thalictroides]|uniref:Uncharacterized protein n=1 Tax=Thalictrum thalictroides TaxID=46969 RepID=A0A7J6XDA6_THATH|nr:hypothetical protein FRX31_002960 [Thalictrum thalictroides]